MGQRTQIVFQIEYKSTKTTKIAFHCQWGYGRVMMRILMQKWLEIINRKYELLGPGGIESILKTGDTTSALRLTNDIEGEGFEEHIKSVDFRELSQAADWFRNWTDNNNGGMVVLMQIENDPNYKTGIENITMTEIRFLKGSGDCSDNRWDIPFDRWLSFDEYAMLPGNRDFCDEKFREMFHSFMKYEHITDWKGKKKQKNNV